jgi:hypothetical protein
MTITELHVNYAERYSIGEKHVKAMLSGDNYAAHFDRQSKTITLWYEDMTLAWVDMLNLIESRHTEPYLIEAENVTLKAVCRFGVVTLKKPVEL